MSDGSWEQVGLVTGPQTNCTVIPFLNPCFFVGVFISVSFSPLSQSNSSISFESFRKRQNYIYLFIYLLIRLLFILLSIYLYFILSIYFHSQLPIVMYLFIIIFNL